MLWLIRFALFALIIYICYKIIKFIFNPKRKLEIAHEEKRYYFADDAESIQRNFLFTYKGVLFEGEKYIGTTERSFEVMSIFIWPHQTSALTGLTKDDFEFLENEIHLRYPHASIDWKSPIKEFMKK